MLMYLLLDTTLHELTGSCVAEVEKCAQQTTSQTPSTAHYFHLREEGGGATQQVHS